jgi:hypothetical protein
MKDKLFVLVQRHGESSPVHVTKDKGLSARWEAHDPAYRMVREMRINDKALLKQVNKEERSR